MNGDGSATAIYSFSRKNCHNYSWWFIYSSQLGNLDNLFNFEFFSSLSSFLFVLSRSFILFGVFFFHCCFYVLFTLGIHSALYPFVFFIHVVLPFTPVQMATALNIIFVLFLGMFSYFQLFLFRFSTDSCRSISLSLSCYTFLLLLMKKMAKNYPESQKLFRLQLVFFLLSSTTNWMKNHVVCYVFMLFSCCLFHFSNFD